MNMYFFISKLDLIITNNPNSIGQLSYLIGQIIICAYFYRNTGKFNTQAFKSGLGMKDSSL